MSIFTLIDHNTQSFTDEINDELNFLSDTDELYNEYIHISNECAISSALLYDTIGLEDLKETVKKGLKYILKLLLKACFGVTNAFRRIAYFFSKKKSALVLKKLDEDLKSYEVLQPEVVDDSKEFWDNIDFDSLPKATYESKGLGSPIAGAAVVHLEYTILYRVVQLANILQPKDKLNINISKIRSRPELSNFLTKAITEEKKSLQKTLQGSDSVFTMIAKQLKLLQNLSNDLRKINEVPDIKSDIINSFYQSSEILGSDTEKYVRAISESFKKIDIDKPDPILSLIDRVKNVDSQKYISNSYKKLLVHVMASIESSFLSNEVQNVIKEYENIHAQVKPVLTKITKEDKSTAFEPIDKTLKAWTHYINNTNNILKNVGYHIGAVNKAINNMGLQPDKMK